MVSPPYTDPSSTVASLGGTLPSLNAKPNAVSDPPPAATVPPTVSCGVYGGNGCDSITYNTGGVKSNPNGLNALNNLQNSQNLGAKYGTVEPPDQGLCSGGGKVMEIANQGILQVFNSNLKPISGVIPLDGLMGLTSLGWSSGGDIMCQYDYANGGHWIITEFVSTSPESSGGPFAGCFAATYDSCREGIAVSVNSNPLGAYYVYFLDPNNVNGDPGTGYLLNDYAKTATTTDAFLLFYDEFNLVTGGLNGVQQFAFSKNALEHGLSTVNVAEEDFGTAPNLSPIPANGVFQPSALPGSAWYQVIPAQTTDPSQYDNNNGGTGFMVASLDFFGTGDNRVAVFDWTGLSALNSPGCDACGHIQFGGQLLTGSSTYQDEGAACPASEYLTLSTFCGLSPQKAGPTPLGDNCVLAGLAVGVTSCPESGVATNGDGATEAFYSGGLVWTAVSTVVSQAFTNSPSEFHVGATYWAIGAQTVRGGVNFHLQQQGVVSALHEDMAFPSVAVTGGTVLMSFTLSGNGGPSQADHGGFYPSSAYLLLSGSIGGFGQNVVHLVDTGASPQDGFSEYQGYSATYGTLTTRPRWGDYGQAVFDPSTGKFVFSTEFIQHPNCGDSSFLNDPTCGGTRAPLANWGSSINIIGA